MATTENLYTGDGSTVLFSFTFPYIEEAHIQVSLDGAATTEYTLANATTVELNTAPAGGVAIRIYRDSDGEAPEATFFPGSAIRAADLNDNFLQSLYLNQETRRVAQEASLGGIADGSINTAKLGTAAVTDVKIGPEAVTEAKIGTGAVTEAKIGASAVTNSKVAANAIDTTHLTDDAVTNAKLATAAVNTDELADSAITQAKIGTNVLTPRVSEINGGPLAGFRNAIINGNFDIWQRGTSFASLASGDFLADRWRVLFNGGGTRTLSRQSFTLGQTDVPSEPTYFLKWNQTVAGSAQTVNDLRQKIESVRSFAGQQVALSFYAKAASAATLPSVGISQQFGTGGSPSAELFTQAAASVALTTSWQRFSYTFTLPSITGKTLGSDGNDSLDFLIRTPLNATFNIDIAQVQVEAGPVATPFERRPIGTELALCQRYYETGHRSFFSGDVTSANVYYSTNFYSATKRATPTLTLTNSSVLRFDAVVGTVTDNGTTGFTEQRSSNATGPGRFASAWTSDAEL